MKQNCFNHIGAANKLLLVLILYTTMLFYTCITVALQGLSSTGSNDSFNLSAGHPEQDLLLTGIKKQCLKLPSLPNALTLLFDVQAECFLKHLKKQVLSCRLGFILM